MSTATIKWTDREQGWLEGIIDGEGSLSLVSEKRPSFKSGVTWKPKLAIGNTNKKIIDLAKRLTGAGNICRHRKHRAKRRDMYTIELYSNALRIILPRLNFVAKEEQKGLLLEALQLLKERKKNSLYAGIDWDKSSKRLQTIAERVRFLNKKWDGVDLTHGKKNNEH